jgi:hypothetical protein
VKRLSRTLLGALMAMTLGVPVGATLGLASSGASALAPCGASALATSLGRGSGAAGTEYVTLLITSHVKGTNASTGWCTISGTPATQFGVPESVVFRSVGPAATKLTFPGRGKTIVLKPGAVASVTIGVETAQNFRPSKCRMVNVSRVRLIFKSGAELFYTLRRTQVCTKLASTTTSGVVLGTRYP